MAVDGRCQVPRARWMSAVEEAPAASEYTKMGGCVGLRLSRVTWSYVLAFGGTSLQNPHSAFSIWAYGHRGSRTEGRAKYCPARRPPPTYHFTTLSTQIPFCCCTPATYSGLAQTRLAQDFPGQHRHRSNLPG